MTARAIMIQGTGSDVGKSLLVAGLALFGSPPLTREDAITLAPEAILDMVPNKTLAQDLGPELAGLVQLARSQCIVHVAESEPRGVAILVFRPTAAIWFGTRAGLTPSRSTPPSTDRIAYRPISAGPMMSPSTFASR